MQNNDEFERAWIRLRRVAMIAVCVATLCLGYWLGNVIMTAKMPDELTVIGHNVHEVVQER